MKIEILKSVEGNEQKQNKPTNLSNPKSPKPRLAHMPIKDKAREKATLRLGYNLTETENSPQLLQLYI